MTKKETVIVFVEVFLGQTMTFVSSQINELEKKYNVVVVSNELANQHLFPGNAILVKYDYLSRIIGFLGRKLGLFYCVPPIAMWYTLSRIKKNNKVLCCICHFGTAGLQVGFILKLLKIPCGVIIHGVDGSALLQNKAYRSQLKRLRNMNFIFASKSLSDNFTKYNLNPVSSSIINLGIKIIEYNNQKNNINLLNKFHNKENLIFFQASNFVPKKGHKYTILAFNEFLKKYPNAVLYLAGDGILKQEIMNLATNLQIEKKVIFLGHLKHEEVIYYFQKADIFLHHSVTGSNGDQESIPTVIVEAMLFGLPVISTFHSGIPEVINDAINGYLVQEKNILEYVGAIDKAIKNSNYISQNAHKLILDKFDLTKNLNKILEFSKKKHD
jgi:colanic acid/amylovoran biosynthesis glycosyltransferase